MNIERKIHVAVLIIFTIAIPILGYTLGIKGPLFHKSLSRIAGDNGLFLHLFFLMNCVIAVLLLNLSYLKRYHNLGDITSTTGFIISCVLLEITVITPYVPHELTILAKIHNYSAYLGVGLIILVISYFLITLLKFSRKACEIVSILFLGILAICLTIIFVTGNPSCFFEVTLMTLISCLFIFTIFILYKIELKKQEGGFKITYKIVNKRDFDLVACEIPKNVNDILTHEHFESVKKTFFRNKIIKQIFFYYDIKNDKTLIATKNNLKGIHPFSQFDLPKTRWAVFMLDDHISDTKQKTWDYINNIFSSETNLELVRDVHLESYLITKNDDLMRCEIWIPIKES